MAYPRYAPLNEVTDDSVSLNRISRFRDPFDDSEFDAPNQALRSSASRPELPLLSNIAPAGLSDPNTLSRSTSVRSSTWPPGQTTEQSLHSPHPVISNEDLRQQRPRPESTWSARSRQSILDLKGQFRYSLTPSIHDMPTRDKIGTARRFNYFRQARRLWRLTAGECFLTWLFCGVYIGILKVYERKGSLDENGRHVFNTLITGISLFIGINLTASLRSYAKLLRWRLLAYCYRPLATFDLVLGCDSLMNCLQLIVRAKNPRHKYIPSWTQLFAFLWLVINLGMTLFIGMVSLNFGLNASASTTLTSPGLAKMVDFGSLLTDQYYLNLNNINVYGVVGYSNNIAYNTSGLGYEYASYSSWTTANNGTTQFFFRFYSLDWSVYTLSHVHIRSDVQCVQHNVTDGIDGSYSWFVYQDNGPHNVSYPTEPIGQGGLLVSANTNSTCGNLCTNVNAFQAGNVEDPLNPGAQVFTGASYFICNSTLSYLLGKDGQAVDGIQPDDEIFRMLAGGIGWTDAPTADSTWQYQVYGLSSDVGWAPEHSQPTNLEMQDNIAQYIIGGITTMSTTGQSGIYFHTVFVDEAPVAGQYLDVSNWKYTYLILIGIPVGHMATMFLVIYLANDTLIKDFSHLAISKLYWSLLKDKGLGQKGCMLSGIELVEHMGNPQVVYGWNETDTYDTQGRMIGHVDVYEKGQPYSTNVETSFRRDVFYDGDNGRQYSDVEKDIGGRLLEDFDAKEWF